MSFSKQKELVAFGCLMLGLASIAFGLHGCGLDTTIKGLPTPSVPPSISPVSVPQSVASNTGCSVNNVSNVVYMLCGINAPVYIGEGGSNSTCSAQQVEGGVSITCGSNASVFLTDGTSGTNGLNGTSCTAAATTGGLNITCGSNAPVFLSDGTNSSSNPGLLCDVYSVLASDETGVVNWTKLFTDGTIEFQTILSNIGVPNESNSVDFATFTQAQQSLIGDVNYAISCTGFITVPVLGQYTFAMSSDDGSELIIDNNVILNMPQEQAYTGSSTALTLNPGQHTIVLFYFQGPPTNIGWTLSWQGPSNAGLGNLSVIPSSVLSH